MNFRIHFAALTLVVVGISACAVTAPTYTPSLRNVETLRRNAVPISVSKDFKFDALTDAGAPSLRLSATRSPVGDSFSDYLRDALSQDISLAGRLDPSSATSVHVVLVQNQVNASMSTTGSGTLSAAFVVTRNGHQIFSKIFSASGTWDSSFFGGHAVGKAQTQFPLLVQALLSSALSDTDFLKSIGKQAS
jgi:hypothetical protein